MYWLLVLLCLVAPAFGKFRPGPWQPDLRGSPGFGGPWQPGFEGPPGFEEPWQPSLKVNYGSDSFAIERENLFDLPQSVDSARAQGYILKNTPRLPPGYCPLQLWCRREDHFGVCIYTDETGVVAGVQINIPCDDFIPTFNMREQGFRIWTTTFDHDVVRFYFFSEFFVAPDADARFESRNLDSVLRDSQLYYTGFEGKLASVATDTTHLQNIFTKQRCIDGLGDQYFYNMNRDLDCSASTLSPFSAMFNSGQLVGSRLIVFGTLVKDRMRRPRLPFEEMNAVDFKVAVPHGPSCLNNIARQGGLSITIFYTRTPWKISCKPF